MLNTCILTTLLRKYMSMYSLQLLSFITYTAKKAAFRHTHSVLHPFHPQHTHTRTHTHSLKKVSVIRNVL